MIPLPQLLLALAIAAPTTVEPSLVLAVDSSRSLSAAELDAAADHLADVVDALPGGLPVGVIAFHDRPEWRVHPTPAREAVHEALSTLVPEGSVTVLNEALITASQELPSGGLVLVVSDGRDEGSAVTAADVERRYARLDVRILTLSIGRSVDDRALRRLSLLTQGRDFGSLGDGDPARLAAAIRDAWQDWLGAQPESPPAATPPPPPSPETRSAAESGTARDPVLTWPAAAGIAVVALLGLLAIISAIWRLRHRAETPVPGTSRCSKCGATIEDWDTSCAACEIAALEEAARTRQVDDAHGDGPPDPLEALDPGLTMAVADLGYLVFEADDPPDRRFALPRSQTFTVGRAPEVNSLQVDDPTVSAQHFKVIPRDDQFYIVDLDTTNGTTVNHERVRVRRLSPGDVIRAGLCEFRFELSKGTVN
jgi:hypothetical protein